MYVVIDTNIHMQSWFMTLNDFRLVLRAASDGRIDLVVPKVVLHELIAEYEKAVKKGAKTLKDARNTLGMLQTPGHEEIPHQVDPKAARASFQKRFLEMIQEAHGEVVAIPSVPHESLVIKATSRKKPFKESGEGYGDALIWETVLNLARDAEVAFVSRNFSDFAQRGSPVMLADELKEEVARAGGHTVTLYENLKSLVEQLIPVAEDPLEELRERLRTGSKFRDQMADLVSLAIEPFSPFGVGKVEEREEAEIELKAESDAYISWINAVTDIDVEDGRLLNEISLLFTVSATADVQIQFHVHKAEAYDLADRAGVEVLDWDWNEHYVLAEAERELLVTCEGTYDTRSGSLSNVKLVHASA